MKLFLVVKNHWLLILILIIGVYLRFYNFSAFMEWESDHGRDVLVAKHIVLYKEFVSVGPWTSVHLDGYRLIYPPHYYYFIALLYFLLRDPIKIGYFYAFLGIATIIVAYFAGKEIFDKRTGLLCALSVSFSYSMILFSRSIWSHPILPLGIFLFLFFGFKAIHKNNLWYFLFASMIFGLIFFIHWLMLLLVPLYLIWFFYTARGIYSKVRGKGTILAIIIVTFLFLGLSIPVFSGYKRDLNEAIFLVFKYLASLQDSFNGFLIGRFFSELLNNLVGVFLVNFDLLRKIPFFKLSVYLITLLWIAFGFYKKEIKENFIIISLGLFIGLILFSLFSISQDQILFTGRVGWYQFSTLSSLIFIITAYVLSRFGGDKFIFALFLLFFYLSIMPLVNFYSQVSNTQFDYQVCNEVAKDIADEVTKEKIGNFLIFGSNPTSDVHYADWNTPQYWFLLEERLQKKLIKVVNITEASQNMQIINGNHPEKLFLVCIPTVSEKINELYSSEEVSYFMETTPVAQNRVISKKIEKDRYIIYALE
ncbi:hypothetical protein COU95_02500 [Candidatus Shapirobacteria bacterium CG10_big_fil_rev_8_21_14_0_10_40_9]|uniref:Glycosyltransferase RgtA/B/C/D-like domain-containing protein n=1 Tax=Candidatus Shapirobacteria bacterium CG10_big_fil_rev_8_21_14_0_10_40_9 TaxID=1974888 RepID=A0A2M8L3F8_9BACT|nr:MAG: hypothetical protein COU95_02500 [Candidatus Shapirobacteria bacterium CG10_big_fil_rev_8_21_14_0_10_40_9]